MLRLITLLIVSTLVMCSNAYQIEINSANAHAYQDVQNKENAFKYGYQVRNVNDQFQHKRHTPENVTYGCYGYTDPFGGVQLTFFVADQFGYRTVERDQAITVHPTPGQNPVLKQWNELPFPEACLKGLFDNSNARASSQSAASGGLAQSNSDFGNPDVDSTNDHSVVIPFDTKSNKSSQTANQCWRPFVSEQNNSFLPSFQCEAKDKEANGFITLFFPFRIACSDMVAFEKELKQLVTKFDHTL
uniref:Uncharacterized protein n=1 Tax=Anopheles farauti TaxID=69004 RepID=A0A182QIA9_9DIPT